jgi:hypothetical protein
MAVKKANQQDVLTTEVRFPCPIAIVQGKKLKKKCCKKYKKGKRCGRCPNG